MKHSTCSGLAASGDAEARPHSRSWDWREVNHSRSDSTPSLHERFPYNATMATERPLFTIDAAMTEAFAG